MLKTKKQKINHKRRTRKILKGGGRRLPGAIPLFGPFSPQHLLQRGINPGKTQQPALNENSYQRSSSILSLNSSLRSESRNPPLNTEHPKNSNNTNLQNNDINILSKIKNKYGMKHLIDYLNYLNTLGNLKAETKRLETNGEDHYKKSEESLNLSEYYFDLLTIIQLISKFGQSKVIKFLS
jgi:hypothetical protein